MHDATAALNHWTKIIDDIDNVGGAVGDEGIEARGRAMAATATAALDEVERHVQRHEEQGGWRAEDAVFRARGILKAIEIVGASERDTTADALYSLRGALDTITAEAVEVDHG